MKTKYKFSKLTIALIACLLLFVASMTGAGILYASAQEVEPTPVSVELTSYTYAILSGETYQFEAKVTYDDGTTGTEVTWTSSDDNVIAIDETGDAEAKEAGTATITATAAEGIYASIDVTVVYSIEDVAFTPATLSLTIDGTGTFTLDLPEEPTEEYTYVWYADVPQVATPEANSAQSAVIYTWSFGTTTVNALAFDNAGTAYRASGTVLVTADYFYLTGLQGVWNEQPSEEAAEEAKVLLAATDTPNVYSLTRDFWAYDTFQIIHSGIDEEWTSKIDPYWYDAANSSDEYVANADGMFRVTSYGNYTVKLDLSDGMAKVTIKMNDIFVTNIDFETVESTSAVVYPEHPAEIKVSFYPYNATITADEIKVNLTGAGAQYVTYTMSDIVDDATHETQYVTITVTLNEDAKFEDVQDLFLEVSVNEASNRMQLAVAPAAVTKPETVTFGAESYSIDVNNGENPWVTTVSATVDADATVKGVIYSSDTINVNAQTGEVTASGFGVFTVRATAVGDSSVYAETTVTVYSSAFYLIGRLDGEVVNGWTALPTKDYTSLEGTLFESWGLKPTTEGSITNFTLENAHLDADDLFSIVFLGMAGDWYGAVNSNYFNAEGSSMEALAVNGTDIQVLVSGIYSVELTISDKGVSFTVTLVEADIPVAYDLYLFLERAGDAWDASLSDVENALLAVDGHVVVDGKTNNQVLEFDYDFGGMTPWAIFQFVTATGTTGGFADATWYGETTSTVSVTGTAIENGTFGYNGCQVWYVGEAMPDTLNVHFTVTFDELGAITSIVIDLA